MIVMIDFRSKHPANRDNPKEVKHYREYKSDLKEDFNSRCGYCNDSDFWSGGWRFFQLDHFVPKKYLVKIHVNEYTNLVYSCFFCNNAKRAKWPSKIESTNIVGQEGFINPREEDYCNQFKRNGEGTIVAQTELGRYMIKALKLNLKRHAIIWRLEKLEEMFDQIHKEFEMAQKKIPHDLAMKVAKLFLEYRSYQKELRTENDA